MTAMNVIHIWAFDRFGFFIERHYSGRGIEFLDQLKPCALDVTLMTEENLFLMVYIKVIFVIFTIRATDGYLS
jgi:hypothetical protein